MDLNLMLLYFLGTSSQTQAWPIILSQNTCAAIFEAGWGSYSGRFSFEFIQLWVNPGSA